MSALADDRAALVAALKSWIDRLENGGSVDAPPALAEMLQAQDDGFYRRVAELTARLHRAVVELRLDDRLARMAGDAMPDARHRLRYVVTVTEQAAHRTLDLVEQLQCGSGKLFAAADALQGNDSEIVRAIGSQLHENAGEMRSRLSELAMAQEYQDLTGQIIKRVITMVEDLETALLELLGAHVDRIKNAESPPLPEGKSELLGPVVPGQASASQQDADALLADLGL